MDSYPSNSHKSKETDSKLNDLSKRARKLEEDSLEDSKKIEKVVEGKVIRRKKPLGKRFAETFFSGDARSAGSYALFEIVLPAIKDTIADVTSQGIERMLWGETRSTSRRTGSRPGYGNGSFISYNRFSSDPRERNRREESRFPSRRSRASHNFDEIILATRVEAEEVIDRLFDLVNKYEEASVADLYELLGIDGDYTDDKWGWTDIRGAGVTRISNGYLLDLPRPEPLGR